MKARPILFSGAMVRAILDGRKTQTRRSVKGEPLRWLTQYDGDVLANPENDLCPYGNIGDLLWVRETWQEFFADELPSDRRNGQPGRMGIPADPDRHSVIAYRAEGELPDHPNFGKAIWRPSIYMPRWASRITLEITGVRVERLQDISEEDAQAEGISYSPDVDPRHDFQSLWESINGAGSWNANPFAWVVTFKPIMANIDSVLRERNAA